MTECAHTITRGREGQKGSWCEACGAKVTEVHDRPCGQCRHIREVMGGHICRKHLMAVVPSMHVNYYLEPWADEISRGGLCFEVADGQDT